MYIVLFLMNFFLLEDVFSEVLPDSIAFRFNKQLQLYPQEKLYVQTDKPYYIGGEDLWFRAFLTDYTSNIPDTTSRYVYTELVDPMDSVLVRVKTIPRDGAYYGNIRLSEFLPEGSYQLRSYTRYMCGLGDEYLFRKQIYIRNSFSSEYRVHADFDSEPDEKKIRGRLRFEEIKSGLLVEPKQVRLLDKRELQMIEDVEKERVLKMSDDSIYRFKTNPEKDYKNRTFCLECEYTGGFHEEYISIPYRDEEYDVSFFPEGGNFPSDVETRIGFKALSPDGMGKEVTGCVKDSSGTIRAEFRSNPKGMGSFVIKSKAGEHLYAECENQRGELKRFDLPLAESDVLTLSGQWSGDILNIFVLSAHDEAVPEGLYLLLHVRGALLYCSHWDNRRKYFQMKSEDLPSGIIEAALVDDAYNPVSERLFFNLNESDLAKVEVKPDRPVYKTRDSIHIDVLFGMDTLRTQEGTFAVSVTTDKDVHPDTMRTILTTFLLTSELKGYIESPGWYFSSERKSELDNLMLTQGWRRYRLERILKGDYEHPSGVLELGSEISGRVKGGFGYRKNKPGCQVSATSFVPPSYSLSETDENGRFRLTDIEMPENTRFLVQALTSAGKENVELTLDPISSYPPISLRYPCEFNPNKESEEFTSGVNEQYAEADGIRTIHLKGVVVKAKKYGKSSLSSGEGRIISQKQLDNLNVATLSILLQAKPSLNYPLIIDGISHAGIYNNPEFINNIPKDCIEELEIVEPYSKGAFYIQAKIWPPAGYNVVRYGALLVTTKDRNGGFPVREGFNKKSILPLGYQRVKEFYAPHYETAEDRKKVASDLRTTLYWNPCVKIQNGKAAFNFYSADTPGSYTVRIEGVTQDGKLIYSLSKVMVKN